ncbi:MAG: hypothetical protein MI922_15745 [Bacteroidales bacterium]|nr:hypothetical protein [Bacteroidales bacterium]
MKKVFTIAFTFFYLAVSVGVSVNMHYCHDRLVSVTVYADAKECCCTADFGIKKSCCTYENIFVMLEESQQPVSSVKLISSKLLVSTVNIETEKLKQLEIVTDVKLSPINYTQSTSPPLWLLNSNFTFYG